MKFLFFLFLFSTLFAQAKTSLYYFGGGGEVTYEYNRFNVGFQLAEKLATTRKWKAQYQVDTDNGSTAKIVDSLKSTQQKSVKKFTSDNYLNQLKDLKKEIETRPISKGEQLLVIIDTHGDKKDVAGENHITTADGKHAPLTTPIIKLIEVAAKKGIKLGLVLNNCYSGDVRHLFPADSNVCIVSGSSLNRLASTKTDTLMEQLLTAPNLEEAYLESRKKMLESAVQPGINTSAGVLAERDLDVFRNFKYHKTQATVVYADRLCENNDGKLDRLIARARAVEAKTQQAWIDAKLGSGEEIALRLKKAFLSREAQMNELALVVDTGPLGISLDQCLEKKQSDQCSQIYNPSPQDLKSESLRHLRSEVESYRRKWIDWQQKRSRLNEETWGGNQVPEERALYDAFYRHYAQDKNAVNPCRNFKLN